jgi:hypothetical protein
MSWPLTKRCAAPPAPGALAVWSGSGTGVYGLVTFATTGGPGDLKSGPSAQPASASAIDAPNAARRVRGPGLARE